MKIYKLKYGISGMIKLITELSYNDLAISEQCLYDQLKTNKYV